MNQWFDDCLVAIYQRGNGQFAVRELAPRQTMTTTSARSWLQIEGAEDYIRQQYGDRSIIEVDAVDIAEEIIVRKAWIEKQEQDRKEVF